MTRKGEKRVARRNLEDTRRLVVHSIEKGMYPEDAAEVYGCGRSTVYKWWSEYLESGPEAFKVKVPEGPKRRLSGKQLTQLRAWVVGRDPRQLQFDFALWTRNLIRDLIKREFGIEYTLQAVGNILRDLGLSPQRPLVRAYEQDPERVRKWKDEQYPAIAAAAKAQGAAIFFGDEASVRTDFHSGTTWAPVGQTPVVRGTGKRKSVNMISAVSARGKMHFSFVDGNVNAEAFIEYCKKLLHDIPGRIFLIVDGHGAHKAKKTQEFVKSTGGRLTLFLLPPYSPELNPDEWVWKNIKNDRVGKMAACTLDDMKEGIIKAVSRLQSGAELVRGFFRSPDLRYITI
jgi:transposase